MVLIEPRVPEEPQKAKPPAIFATGRGQKDTTGAVLPRDESHNSATK